MKKLIFIFFLFLYLNPLICFGEESIITYEQLVSGDFNGETVEIRAKAVPINQHYNLIYMWSVEKEDGSFAFVDMSQTRWCVSEEDYDNASSSEKEAFNNKDVFILTVWLRNDGQPSVREFRIPGAMSEAESMELFIAVSAGMIVLCIFILIGNRKRDETIPVRRQPQVTKTKFIDSAHTATSRVKTGSAVGRAAVGGMIAGPIGAMVGASTAKHKTTEHHTTTFMVYYDDGTRKVETVSNGSHQYDKYMKLLDMGD